MIFTLGDVCSLASRFAGGRNDQSLSEVSQYANIALQQVQQYAGHRPPEALAVSSTTSGEGRYNVPADFDYATSLTLYTASSATTGSRTTTANTLTARDASWVDTQSFPNFGVPAHYCNYSTWLELVPSPNSAYSMQLRYMSKPQVLVNSTDTILLDPRWHMAVALKTSEYVAAARNQQEAVAMARNQYLDYVSSVPSDLQLKQRDRQSMALRFTGFTRRPS